MISLFKGSPAATKWRRVLKENELEEIISFTIIL